MTISTTTKDLVNFLLKAKAATYAAGDGSARVTPLVPGSHQLDFSEGPFLYRDIYFGGRFFIGQETVYRDNHPYWGMGYAGGLLNELPSGLAEMPIYLFLQSALRKVAPDRPFRGPVYFKQDLFEYQDESKGGIDRFQGTEIILYQGMPVYQLHYHGGWILD